MNWCQHPLYRGVPTAFRAHFPSPSLQHCEDLCRQSLTTQWKTLMRWPGLEPASPDCRSGVLTTTPQRPCTGCCISGSTTHCMAIATQLATPYTTASGYWLTWALRARCNTQGKWMMGAPSCKLWTFGLGIMGFNPPQPLTHFQALPLGCPILKKVFE